MKAQNIQQETKDYKNTAGQNEKRHKTSTKTKQNETKIGRKQPKKGTKSTE